MKKSPMNDAYDASHVTPAAIAPSSSAEVAVGPGALAGIRVPSQTTVLTPLVMVLPSVVTGPSNSVCVEPSTRSCTVTGAAIAAPHPSSTSTAASARDLIGIRSLPFLEGRSGLGRRQTPGFRVFRRPFP